MSLTSVKQGIKIADIHCEIECDSTLLSHLEPKLGGFFKNGVAPYKLVMRQNGPENSKWLNNAIPHMVPHPNKIIVRQDGIFELEMDLNTRCAELSYRLRPGDLTHRWPPRGPWMGLKCLYASLLLRKEQGAMVHAGGVYKNNKAFVFLGHSGAGKSTLTELLENRWGHQAVLNDESIALVFSKGCVVAHSTPFSGLLDRKRFRNQANAHMLLNLVQDTKTEFHPFAIADRLRLAMECTVLPPGDEGLEKRALNVGAKLAKACTWRAIHFTKNESTLDELFQKEAR